MQVRIENETDALFKGRRSDSFITAILHRFHHIALKVLVPASSLAVCSKRSESELVVPLSKGDPVPQPTPLSSMILFLVAAFVGALGQFLYKSGAEQTTNAWLSYVMNWRLMLGVLCYVAVMVLFVAAFKRGGALSVLYPLYASTFIWAAVIGLWAYGVPIRLVNVAGMILLVAGMFLMGK
jgi:multidrug transporter EmrE-like cation transporter